MEDRNNDLFTRIRKLQTAIKEFKSPQPIGSDSVRAYTNLTNNEWDIDITIVPSVVSLSGRYLITFKAENQVAPFGDMRVIAEFDGVKYDPLTPENVYLNGNYVAVNASPFGFTLEHVADPSIIKFEVRFSAASVGTNLRMKFIVDATDTGEISWIGGQQVT